MSDSVGCKGITSLRDSHDIMSTQKLYRAVQLQILNINLASRTRHAVGMGRMRNASNTFARKLKGRDYWGDLGVDGRILLQCGVRIRTGLKWSTTVTSRGLYESGFLTDIKRKTKYSFQMATILLCPQRKKVSCSSKMHHHDTGITDS
jgi:hypothetical protein